MTTKRNVSILDLALHLGAKENADGSGTIDLDAIEAVGLPGMGGCQRCGATLAAYNAYPSKNGYLRCEECLGDNGFTTVEEANKAIFGQKDG